MIRRSGSCAASLVIGATVLTGCATREGVVVTNISSVPIGFTLAEQSGWGPALADGALEPGETFSYEAHIPKQTSLVTRVWRPEGQAPPAAVGMAAGARTIVQIDSDGELTWAASKRIRK